MISSNLAYDIGVAAAIIVVLVSYWIYAGRKRRRISISPSPYAEALGFLIDGERIKALEKLKQVVKSDTNNVDAYIRLGDIYRDYGKAAGALRVHQSLTIRKDLTYFQKLNVLRSLLLDHKELKQWDKAVETAEKILDLDRGNEWVRKKLLRIYKEKGDWEGAGKVLRDIQKQKKVKDNKTLAIYLIQEGLAFQAKGNGKDARVKFKKALKIDHNCSPAHYYIGESYLSEKRKKEAVSAWRRFAETDPEHAHLVFDKLEDLLFELGNFDESEKIYKELLDRDNSNVSAMTALADLYDRKGDHESALELLRRAVDRHPNSLRARTLLIRMLAGKNSSEELKENVESMLSLTRRSREFRCRCCSSTSTVPLWVCPNCLEENTYLN